MMRPRTVVLIGALSLVAGWMAGTTSSPFAQAPPTERGSAPRPLGVPPAKGGPYTEQLRRKLQDHPRSPQPGRNPFVFGARPAPSAARGERAEVTAAAVDSHAGAVRSPAPVPMFTLSGVASTHLDGVVVRTAMLIDNLSMVFAKAGDTLSGGHRVVRVDEDAVVIIDADGVTQTIRLP